VCSHGVTVIRDQVLAKIPGPRLRIYAVWLPILRTDEDDKVPEATSILAAEARASQYWDPSGESGRRFARTLDLPLKTPAWDVYLLYAPKTRWEAAPPPPVFWMHQLSFMPFTEAWRRFGKKRLDGARFREEVEKLIATLPPQRK